MTEPLARYTVDEHGIALLQLDRPDRRNAINTPMLEQLLGHIAAARDDEGVR
ncbi:MAG: enoyl-CoA hydratase/isomerase family protein, partial [Solirubrobacterales bacterium]